MDFSSAVICILFTTLAASYAWGMRGAVIGGEKGAMLPGAFIGLIIGHFSGMGAVTAAAAGLMGMTFGGIEPYGETIGMVLHRGRADYKPIKGYTGLAMKGALWFSICGGFIAFSLSYGVYSSRDIYIFCLLIPVIQLIGYWIFNTPYNKEKGIYPKIYYSLTRREEWGSNLTLLIAMLAMAVIRGDDFALVMMSFGFFFGAVGWLVAMKMYVLSVFPLKNGKYLFGKLYHKGLIDGWKLMEFVLGAFGGFGLSLAFCTGYGYVKVYKDRALLDGVKFFNEYLSDWIPIVCIFCAFGIFAVNLVSFICDKKNKKISSFMLDRIERIFYSVIPMIFVLSGSTISARFMSAFMLVFVVVIKLLFDRFKKVNALTLIISAAVCTGAYLLLFEKRITSFVIILAGTVPYLAAELICRISKQSRKNKTIKEILTQTSFATVYPAFIVMSILILIVSYKIF